MKSQNNHHDPDSNDEEPSHGDHSSGHTTSHVKGVSGANFRSSLQGVPVRREWDIVSVFGAASPSLVGGPIDTSALAATEQSESPRSLSVRA
jgi:hypothetical protein